MKRIGLKLCMAAASLSLSGLSFGAAKVVILGRLGEATRKMGIHAWLSPNSHVYWTVSPEEYLVVNSSSNKDWLSVLLQNGHRGYVPKDSIVILPFNVTRQVDEGPVAGYGARYAAASDALQYLGTPYVWGGNSLRHGVDCSGFVKRLFGQIGIDLPRTAAEQALVGEPITRYEDLKVGDRLYFWDSKEGKIGHTGIYIGNGQFVHSSVNHHGVATDYLTPAWRKILVAARR